MSITLSNLCRDAESKYNMKLIAGKQGMGNAVRWVHMIEDRQVPEFLHGGELVFTTGIGHVGSDPLISFVQKLKENHAAGVVINIGPYLSQVPEDVIVYCNRTGFPIFTIPWKVYIIDITYDFCRRIINNEKKELTVSELFRKLIAAPEKRNEVLPALQLQGFSRINPYTVLSLRFWKDGKNVTSHFYELHSMQLWNRLARSNLPTALFLMQERLVVIRQNMTQAAICEMEAALAGAMRALTVTYAIGVSTEVRGFLTVPELLQQADAALLTAEIHGDRLAFYQSIGINKLLFCAKDNPAFLVAFAEEYLGPVLAYDRTNGTDYAKALEEYLKQDGSVQLVAEHFGIHRNTVNGKIRQIKDLLGCELTGRKKMELLLAFSAKEVADYLRLNGGN